MAGVYMFTDNYIRYTHHKPPYKNEGRFYCNSVQNRTTPEAAGVHNASSREAESADTKKYDRAGHCGLLHYRKWWERIEVDISVAGKIIRGKPMFIEENTLRVINNDYSYFIPIEKVDYIRTADGLHSLFRSSDENY